MPLDLGIKYLLVCEAAALLWDLLINWPCLRLVSPDSLRLVNSARSFLFCGLSCGVKSGAIKKFLKDVLFLNILAFLSISLLEEISVGEINKGLGLLPRLPKQKHLVVSKLLIDNDIFWHSMQKS